MTSGADEKPREERDEIEVTSEMIEAGCRVAALYSSEDSTASLVESVYVAMEEARRAHRP